MKSLKSLSTTECGVLVIELLQRSGLLVVEAVPGTEIFMSNEQLLPFKDLDPSDNESWEKVKPYLISMLKTGEYELDARRSEVFSDGNLVMAILEKSEQQDLMNIEFYQIICSPFLAMLNMSKEEPEEVLSFPKATEELWNHLASTILSLLSGARNGILTYSLKGEYEESSVLTPELYQRTFEWIDDAMEIKELSCLLSFQSLLYSWEDRGLTPRIDLTINPLLGLLESEYIKKDLLGRDFCQMIISFFEIVIFDNFEQKQLDEMITQELLEEEFFQLKSV